MTHERHYMHMLTHSVESFMTKLPHTSIIKRHKNKLAQRLLMQFHIKTMPKVKTSILMV